MALLLNVVSLLFATINYWRGKLIDWRVGVPILITAVLRGAQRRPRGAAGEQQLLLGLFDAFLIFAGAMMLSCKARPRTNRRGLGWRSTLARARHCRLAAPQCHRSGSFCQQDRQR